MAHVSGGGGTSGIWVYVGGQVATYTLSSVSAAWVVFPVSFSVNPGETYQIVNSSAVAPVLLTWVERD